MNDLFYPAKIGRNNDYIWMISLNDHLVHVETVGQVIGLQGDGLLAARYHDIGKRVRLENSIAKQNPETPRSFLKAYKNWLKEDIFNHGTSLRSPFKTHAKRTDKDRLEKEQGINISDYTYELIRHHHGFKVTEIVTLANKFGKRFIDDLHFLISADNICSAIYEKALTEKKFKIGDIKEDKFLLHDFTIDCEIVSENAKQKEALLTSDSFNNPAKLILNYHIFQKGDLE